MAQHAGGGRVIDAAAIVLETNEHLVVAVGDEGEWVVGLAVIGEPEARTSDVERPQRRVERVVLVDQDRVEERTASRNLAPALHLRERGVLVLAQLDLPRSDFRQQLVETTARDPPSREAEAC